MEEGQEQEVPLRELQEVLSDLNSLVDSRGWKRLMQIAQAQIETRRNNYEAKPLKAIDETLEQEFLKGEVTGIRTFCQLPTDEIEDLQTQIATILEETENADSNTETEHA